MISIGQAEYGKVVCLDPQVHYKVYKEKVPPHRKAGHIKSFDINAFSEVTVGVQWAGEDEITYHHPSNLSILK